MKVEELLKKKRTKDFFKNALDIMEAFNTTFSEINWKIEKQDLVGYGLIEDIKIQLIIAPVVYNELHGLNLSFRVWDGERFKETIRTIKTEKFSKIVGAITNAFKSKINEFEWHFITLIAKDEIEKRMKLYSHIASRISRELLLSQSFKNYNSCGIILIVKSHINPQQILDTIVC